MSRQPSTAGGAEINTPQIGPVLQRRRKARGLTLEQLAQSSGVSKSMLSQVERGQANPTFAILWSLTRALKIEFADLLDGGSNALPDDAIEVVTVGHTPEIRNADGTCRLRILSPPTLSSHVEWYDVEIEPKGALDSRPHAPGTVEHFTALSGAFEITSDGAAREIKTGETARYAGDVPHRIANVSSRRAKGLMVVLFR